MTPISRPAQSLTRTALSLPARSRAVPALVKTIPSRILLVFLLLATASMPALAQVHALDRVGLTSATPASPAYSLRKLSTSYTGSAIRVRRSSDNATLDVGFTAGGDLDTVSLKAFGGAQSLFVTTWYDQGGRSINATQATNSLQPRILDAGVVERINSRPALYFGTASLATAAQTIFTNNASMVGFAKGNSTTPSALVTKTGTASGFNPAHPAPFDYTNNGGEFTVGQAQTGDYQSMPTNSSTPVSGVRSSVPASVYSFVINHGTAACHHYLNGVQAGSLTLNYFADNGAALRIGNRNDGSSAGNFWTSEIVLFNEALSTANRTTLETAFTRYHSTESSLAALSVSNVTLAPAFTSSSSGVYTGSTGLSSVTLSATATGGGASIRVRVNDEAWMTPATGSGSWTLSLPAGMTSRVDVEVTGLTGATRTYQLALRRLNGLDVLGLTGTQEALPAFSLRRLSSSYAGAAIRVRRSTDNALQGIGFTAAGDLDTAALKTFVGAADGFVIAWVDQGGWGMSATQSDPALQPLIVRGGIVERLHGRPALYFGTASLATAAQVLYPTAVTMTGVAKGDSSVAGSLATKTGTAGGANAHFPAPFDFTNAQGAFTAGSASIPYFSSVGLAQPIRKSEPASVYSFVITGANYLARLNGTQSAFSPLQHYADAGAPLRIGNRNDGGGSGRFWTSELVLFNSALSTADLATAEQAQKAYYFIPCSTITFTQQPLSGNVCPGGSRTYTVAASGLAPLSYQWWHNGTPVGGNSATLTLSGITAAQAGSYYCTVTNLCGSATSDTAVLMVVDASTVLPVPTVSGNRFLCSGNGTSLTATGVESAAFAWYTSPSGGTAVAQATTYNTPALSANTTFYVAQLRCGYSSARASVPVLVNTTPAMAQPSGLLATPSVICQGAASQLSATVEAASGQKVYWYASPTGGLPLGHSSSGTPFVVTPLVTTTYYAQSELRKDTVRFAYTGGAQTFTVPDGVTELRVDAQGASGGHYGGAGGRVEGTLKVTPGQVLYIYVGEGGTGFNYISQGQESARTFNGGGHSGNTGGSGGGGTDIRTGGTELEDRVLVAGGGGGGFRFGTVMVGVPGGAGGGLVANPGFRDRPSWLPGGPGTQTEGGAPGTLGYVQFGNGGAFGSGGNSFYQSNGTWGGGGGGGWYGGGGANSAGGGGGSSYTHPSQVTEVIHTQGVRFGHGTLTISYSTGAQCASTSRVPVTVNVSTRPDVVLRDNFRSCPAAPVTLTATGADSYLWSPGNSTNASITVAPTDTTTYTVIGTRSLGGCKDTTQTTVWVADVVATGGTICLGQSVTLSAGNADTYTWQPGNLTGQSVSVSPSATTTYTVTGADSSGCNTITTVEVRVNPLPPTSAGPDQTAPAGTPVTLSASGADTYAWGNVYVTTASLTLTPAESQTYWVEGRYTATGCTYTDSVRVHLLPVPVITGTLSVCPGGATTLTASGTGPFHWYDAATGGNLLFTGASFVTPSLAATTNYWVAGAGGARVRVTVAVIAAMATATPAEICAGGHTELAAANRQAVTSWYDAPTGGNLLATTANGGSLFVAPAGTTTYYAQSAVQAKTDTFRLTNNTQTFTVPAGVSSIRVDLRGASGASKGPGRGGNGGRVEATLTVTPGEVLYLQVGGPGTAYQGSSVPMAGGYNGGGSSYIYGGSGGGASDIRIGGNEWTHRVLVAGGGGGSYSEQPYSANGGHGGDLVGDWGSGGNAAGPGSQSSGGSNNIIHGTPVGVSGAFGQGGRSTGYGGTHGGGGGGGWYGGGGTASSGGGGGSSYSNPALCQNVVHTKGFNEGPGMIILSYALDCADAGRTPVTVTVKPLPQITVSSDTDTTCTTAQLTASGGVSYSWTAAPAFPASAQLAAGLRKLNPDYAGPALQLRRASDGATADFGFSGIELDKVAIIAFLGAEQGYCVKLYDQSGRGNHLVQPDPSRQPLLLLNGIGGRPVLQVSANPARFLTSPVSVAVPYTALYAARQNGPARGRMLSSVSNNWLLGWHGGSKDMAHFDGWVSPSGGIPAGNAPVVYSATRINGATRVFANGTQLYANNQGHSGISGLQVNGWLGGPNELSDAEFGDILLFNTSLPDADRAALERNLAEYYAILPAAFAATFTATPLAPYSSYLVTGTGANGCVSTATKKIYHDGRPPVLQCPADQPLVRSSTCTATLPDYRSLLVATDNCSPAGSLQVTQTPAAGTVLTGMDTLTVQFTVRDSTGYAATCSFRVLPRDTTTLSLTCPASIEAPQEVDVCGAHVTFAPPPVSNCRTLPVLQTGGPSSGSLFPVGSTSVTFTAYDLDGGTRSCSTSVTVLPRTYVISGADSVCKGGSATLQVAGLPAGAPVNWFTQPGGQGTVVGSGHSLPGAAAGTYYAQIGAPCGPLERSFTVSEYPDSLLQIGGDTSLCPGTRGFVTASGFPAISWGPLTLPADAAPASARLAAGLRLLNSTYTGPLLRLRRASDGNEQDFYALGRDLDTAAVRTWLGGGSAFCVTLFDQSGNSRHITQASPGAQPQFILRSAVNNLPALRFTTSQQMRLDATFPAPFTISYTARQTGGSRGRVLSAYRNNWLLGWHLGQRRRAFFEGWVHAGNTAANNDLQVYTGTSSGTVAAFYENGTLIASNSAGTAGPDGLQLNGYPGGEYSDCEILELVVFASVLPEAALVDLEAGALNYYLARSRLLVAAPPTGHLRTYSVTGSRPGCSLSQARSVVVRSSVMGDPAVFGNGTWHVYVWNNGTDTIGNRSWNDRYSGYYTSGDLNFNTTTHWGSGTAPSGAVGYQGCPVGSTNHSWSAKRQGFPCADYRISVASHDDAGQLWINGVKVWEHNACCDAHNNVWEGRLGSTDSVEFRVTQGIGGAHGALQFTVINSTVTLSYPVTSLCNATSTLQPAVSLTGGRFHAAPAGLAIDPLTGIIDAGASVNGSYVITYVRAGTCGDSLRATATLQVSLPPVGPSVFGINSWNVFVWNSGGATINANTWNANFAGAYTVSTVDFNSTAQWANGTAPSGAPGYQGCAVGVANHSWSAKRTGFPCGNYKLSVTSHDDAAELWINGVKVWEHSVCCDIHNDIWEGPLGGSDSVEFRVTQGGGGAEGSLRFTNLTTTNSVVYSKTTVCTGETVPAPVVSNSGGWFTASPSGLVVDSASGLVDVASSTAGSYVITYHRVTYCNDTLRTQVPFRINAVSGDPLQYGDGAWNVYVWNAGGALPGAGAWTTNYSGYYTASGLGFNSTDGWANGAAPSGAPGYQGCAVGTTNHSWSAKRKGFPCGLYRLDVTGHDDAAELWINGQKIWWHDQCCDQHGNVWTGYLDATDSVEFRVTQGTSGGFGSLAVVLLPDTVTLTYPATTACINAGSLNASVNRPGGVFSASPAGLSLDTATGLVEPSSSAAGSYTVTYTVPNHCGGVLTTTAPVTVTATAGDPSVYGSGAWNVYVWNAGTGRINNVSWNGNYSGYYTASGLDFNTSDQWASGTAPSGAPGYLGCAVGSNNHSWSAKREGFPCGRYRIDVLRHEDAGELWINGVKVWDHNNCCDAHFGAWTGTLGAGDRIEFRVTQGSAGAGGQLAIVPIDPVLDPAYPAAAVCRNAPALAATVGTPGGTFSAAPAGLSIDTATGTVTPSLSVPGTYTVRYTWAGPCGTSLVDSTTLFIQNAAGDPSGFGDGAWNVYVYNSGDGSLNTTAWTTQYSGYYVAAGLNFNTTDQWADGTAPSNAPGYQGCAVGSNNHSWSAKRQGFSCGYYSISINSHDDAAQLWINGVKVWEHGTCCDTHADAWRGPLGPSDRVEFRVTQGTGGAHGALSFAASVPSVAYAKTSFCSNEGLLAPAVSSTDGSFTATPLGIALNSSTGVVDAAATTPGTYTIVYSWLSPCGDTLRANTALTVLAVVGDPSVPGAGVWNVYTWADGEDGDSTRSWNTNYVGYSVISTLDFNTAQLWGAYTPVAAPGYQGCNATDEEHSWIARRQGFPCGRYSITVPTNAGSAELWVNGARQRYLPEAFRRLNSVWTGYLSTTDIVELRVRSNYGSHAVMRFTLVATQVSLSYPTQAGCRTGGQLQPSVTGPSGGTFSADGAGLVLNGNTGVIDLGASAPGTYLITYTVTDPCGAVLSATWPMQVANAAGDPSVFGNGAWNVYVYNSGDGTLSGPAWTTNYSGYYVASGLHFNTTNQWSDGAPLSTATGYQGCPVGAGNHSWSAKRTGFPCGFYRLDIQNHDDAGQLFVNGVKVWEHNACCDAHNTAWQGFLGATDSIEFRVTQGNGGANGAFTLTPAQPVLAYSSTSACTGIGLMSPLHGGLTGTFTASPAGLAIDAVTGLVNAGASAAGNYTITHTMADVCGGAAFVSTTTLALTATAGDPSVHGAGVWNVYTWGDGEMTDTTRSWNTNYAGYNTIAPLDFDTEEHWYTYNPSAAPGYQGCPVSDEQHSWIARRQGFPCGRYSIRIPLNDATAQLWINGAPVWYGARYTLNNPGRVAWEGYLSGSDIVELRVRSNWYGSRAIINFIGLAPAASLAYATGNACSNSGPLMPTSATPAGGVFSALPAGLSLNPATGAVTTGTSAAGTYQVTYTATDACGNTVSASWPLQVSATAGSPGVFGAGAWRVYAWNSGGLPGAAWSAGYAGYFSAATLGFNSIDFWDPAVSPSSATGYAGCPVADDQHSWSAKRTGFPCGYYRLSIPDHDDDTELWINGVRVFQEAGIGGSAAIVWEGVLGPQDSVEFRGLDATSGSYGTLLLTPALRSASIAYTGSPYSLGGGLAPVTRTGDTTGVYRSSAGLALDSLSGTINLNASASGIYTVSYLLPAARGCVRESVSTTVAINSGMSQPASQTLCSGARTAAVSFSGCGAGAVYSWTNTEPSIGLAASGTGSLPAFIAVNTTTSPIVATITVTSAGCAGRSFTITVLPAATVPAQANRVVCAGTGMTPLEMNPNYAYSWTNSEPSIGLPAQGTGDLPAFVAANASTASVTAVITIRPSYSGSGLTCPGKSTVFRITVKPLPQVTVPANSTVCAGAVISAVSFTSAVAGATYAWTNSNPAIGLAASGTGDVPSFTAINNSGSNRVATITVTPKANGCSGTPRSYSITATPGAGSIAYPGSPYCASGWAYVQRGGAAGGTFSATPSGLLIDTASGAVNLAHSAPGTYTVTYTSGPNGCGGAATTLITVKPLATVSAIGNKTYCAGAAVPAIPFSGTASAYSWTYSGPSIGLAATGTGIGLPAFTAVNNGTATVTAAITVTPLGNGCPAGKPVTFRIYVQPKVVLAAIADQVHCSGAPAAGVGFTANLSNGVTYSWSRTPAAIGLTATSGTGSSIPAFVTQNASGGTLSSLVTVTGTANKCASAPVTFTYIVNQCVARRAPDKKAVATPKEEEGSLSTAVVGPNPTQRLLTVYTGTASGTYTVRILDPNGQEVLRPASFTGTRHTFDLTGLPAGTYLLQLTDRRTGEQVQRKVVKL
ncbi:glycine-rich protein [Flaviaesturariibacter amylovorans]|uniref:receptor protein-tyrosine kinase n=1 Tax=Flaviaesturariibacter amylovorans TaxID=1084520 RepID=A0ABP8H785_9BACT